MRAPGMLLGVLAALSGVAAQARDDAPPFAFAVATFPARVEQASASRLHVVRMLDGRREVVELSPVPVPPSLQAVVRPQWTARCDVRLGDDVQVSVLDGSAVLLFRKGANPPASGGRAYELCIARAYFDLSGLGPNQPSRERMRALSMALAAMADHDVRARVYIRGEADVVLSAYRDPRQVEVAAQRLGEPRLVSSAARIAAKRDELKGRTVLAEAIPYRYPSWSETPIGGRLFFVLRLFEERGGALVPHVDVSADAAR